MFTSFRKKKKSESDNQYMEIILLLIKFAFQVITVLYVPQKRQKVLPSTHFHKNKQTKNPHDVFLKYKSRVVQLLGVFYYGFLNLCSSHGNSSGSSKHLSIATA